MKQVFWIIVPWFNDVLKDHLWVLKKKTLKKVFVVTEYCFQKCKFDHQTPQFKTFQLT